MNKPGITRQLIVGFAATLSAACAGFHIGWSSPSLPKLLANDSDVIITSAQGSWIASLITLGSTVGPIIGATLADRLGRKWSLLLTVVPFLSSAILLGLAHSFWMFALARFIGGLGTGVSFTILPMYLGEIAEDKIRGALGALIAQMMNAGILLTYCVGPWVSRMALACMGGVLPVLFGLMFIWMPDSPYFLIMKHQPDQAKQSLIWLRGTGEVTEELEKVRESVEHDRKNSGTVRELVMIAGNRKALIIVLGLEVAQQLSGIGAIISYSSLIFTASGSALDSNISVIIVGFVQTLSTLLTVFTVDLTGRKPLLMISVCGTVLFLVGVAVYFQLQACGINVSSIAWLQVTSIVGYMIFDTIGLASLPYVIVSELFPTNVKALATMSISIVGALGGMVTMKLYQIVADAYGIHVVFWGFAVIEIFSGIFIYFILPETKQRSLRDIQEEFHRITENSSTEYKSSKLPGSSSPLLARVTNDESRVS